MRESGRISILGVAGIVAALMLVAVLLFGSRESVSVVGAKFLTALGKHDSETLAKISMMDKLTEAEKKAAWDKCFEHTKHYMFNWKITNTTDQGPNEATVSFTFQAPLDEQTSYEKNQQLKFIKDTDGHWKALVASIDREFYPALPR